MKRISLVALALLLCALAPTAFAADLVNINTADSATLQTLSGIGPSKAQAIIDYRTQNGPFATISDIQNVSGIGPATYANIEAYITVDGAASQAQSQSDTQTQTQTSTDQSSSTPDKTQVVAQSSGTAGPPAISVRITTDATAVVGAGTLFAGAAFGTNGDPLSGARYVWNFGDGATAEGAQVWHTYAYPGSYEVMLEVGYNYSSATARADVAASPASVSLVAEGDGSLTIGNVSDYDLDIGSWSLREGTSTFVIPDGTLLMRGKGVRFSPAVLKFSGDESAQLFYENGSPAAIATVGQNSPLRGEVVDMSVMQPAATTSPAGEVPEVASPPIVQTTATTNTASSSPIVNGNDQTAAASMAIFGVDWVYVAGLAVLVMTGAIGTYFAYADLPKRQETIDDSDEFEIE